MGSDLIRYLHGQMQLDAGQYQLVDMNHDGEADIFDLVLLKRKLLEF